MYVCLSYVRSSCHVKLVCCSLSNVRKYDSGINARSLCEGFVQISHFKKGRSMSPPCLKVTEAYTEFNERLTFNGAHKEQPRRIKGK